MPVKALRGCGFKSACCVMQSGVRPGQRLLTVSDPINVGEDLEVDHLLHSFLPLVRMSTSCHVVLLTPRAQLPLEALEV